MIPKYRFSLDCPIYIVCVCIGSVEDRRFLRYDILNKWVDYNIIISRKSKIEEWRLCKNDYTQKYTRPEKYKTWKGLCKLNLWLIHYSW